jgi:hypothetical protein
MLRIILSPTRSGSTALMRCFENNPAVDRVYHQPVKSGFREHKPFDYGIYDLEGPSRGKIIIAKETIGGFLKPEANFAPIPPGPDSFALGIWSLSTELVVRTRPLVLLRDPLQTWASIERLNRYSEGISEYRSPIEFFLESFANVVRFAVDARDRELPVSVITLEQLGVRPEECLRELCRRWDLPWSPAMIDWTLAYGVRTWFSEEAKHRFEHDPRFRKSKESLTAARAFDYTPSTLDGAITNTDKQLIAQRLMPLYSQAVQIARRDFS